MRVSWRESEFPCGNCGRTFPGTRLDRRMWCPDCRREVVRRSTRVARIFALLVGVALIVWIYAITGPAPRFLMAYVLMVVVAYFFIFKLTQRVAFEVIRARGVPPSGGHARERDGGREERRADGEYREEGEQGDSR